LLNRALDKYGEDYGDGIRSDADYHDEPMDEQVEDDIRSEAMMKKRDERRGNNQGSDYSQSLLEVDMKIEEMYDPGRPSSACSFLGF
jgi:hypothetical protein